jgi:polyisoprenoid-binding protein YceI
MNTRTLLLSMGAALAIAACGQSANGQADTAAEKVVFDAPSGEYTPDGNHHYIFFTYSHFDYSHPHVRWRTWDATLNWNAENPEASSVEVVIEADSVDSGVDVFDGHLKGERFFDAENHPEITFVSTSVTRTSENTGTIDGDLTIKGITLPVTLDVTFNKAAYEERGDRYKMGFSATTTVKRTDFGMDYLAPAVSDEVDIRIESEFVMPAGNNG